MITGLVGIEHNMADFSDALTRYAMLSKLSTKDILEKQGGKLSNKIRKQLAATAPGRGKVKGELLARIKQGKFFKIRPYVHERVPFERWLSKYTKTGRLTKRKTTEQQAKVKLEMALREGGRKALSIPFRYRYIIKDNEFIYGRGTQLLSRWTIKVGAKTGKANLEIGGSKTASRFATGLNTTVPREAVNRGIAETNRDILAYVYPRQYRLAQQAVKQLIKQ